MKITIEHYSETITVETPEEITADDFIDLLYRLGIMVGYQEQSMADACAELGETYYATNQIKQQPPVTDTERLDFLLNRAYAIQLNEDDLLSSRETIDIAMDAQ